MAQVFTGTFERNLDGKNRVLVPSEIRDALDAADRKGLYLIPAKQCVLLWPQSYLDAYSQQQGADPFGNLKFNRAFYSQMIFRAFDGTGRIVLPQPIADRFPQRTVLFAGAGRYLELWDKAAWEQQVTPLDFE